MQASVAFYNQIRHAMLLVVVALLYCISGKAGLMLTPASTYATAIFPAAGVALGAVLIFGYNAWIAVFLGSFVLHLIDSYDSSGQAGTLSVVLVSTTIATAASLQAIAGRFLIRKFSSFPNSLEYFRDIGLLILLGGPVACLTSSTISTFTLYQVGAIPQGNELFSWFTWWVGDSIGVMIFAPIFVLLSLPEKSVSTVRKVCVGLVLATSFVISVYVFLNASALEHRRQQADFERDASNLADALHQRLINYSHILLSIDRLYASSDFVSATEFNLFVHELFPEYPGLNAITWRKRVLQSERAAYEEEMRTLSGDPDFTIRDRNIQTGEISVAPERESYLPTTYVEYPEEREKNFGMDTYNDPDRMRALDIARDTGETIMTGRVTIFRNDEKLDAAVMYRPIYKKQMKDSTVEERRQNLEGFIVASFVFTEVLADITKEAHRDGMTVELVNDHANGKNKILYSSDPDHVLNKAGIVDYHKDITIADQYWQLIVRSTDAYPRAFHGWAIWLVLTGSLLFTGLFGIFLLVVTGRTDVVRRLVDEKTKTLQEQERILEQINTLNQAVLSSAVSLIVAMDSEGHVIVFNQEAEHALGYSASEILYRQSPLIWHDKNEMRQRSAELTEEFNWPIAAGLDVLTYRPRKHGSEKREWIFVRKNGETFPGEMTVTPLLDSRKEPVGFLCIIEDITIRKQQTEALKASEETFRVATENASIGMALVSPEGKFIKANKALCDLTGYTPADLMGKDFQELGNFEDSKEEDAYLRQILAREISTYEIEKRYYHKGGHTIWILMNVSLVFRPDGSPYYFIIQVQDITARKQMERMKSEFISTVSHELRTPLTSIRGSLGLIASGVLGGMPAKMESMVKIAHKNSERLVRIINDILDIEKIEAGSMQIHLQEVGVAAFLAQAVEGNQAYGERFQISFDLEPVADLRVLADPDRLMQVMSNLLSNAAKFSPQGSVVSVRAFAIKDGKVRFEVEDRGSGIPEEFRARIFEKFSQADGATTRKHEGTGLGLSISKQLVEAMQGQLAFQTETGKGTVFYFELLAMEQEEKPAAGGNAGTVLVCEDDAEIAAFTKSCLESAGFAVDIVGTIAAARDALSSRHYVAVTLDIAMPDVSGMEFLHEIRGNPATYNLPVVIISAKSDETRHAINGDALGVVDWILKPVEETKLVQTIQQSIAHMNEKVPLVLHVEDDKDLTKILAESLHGRARFVSAPTLAKAKSELNKQRFNLMILDLSMPDGEGLDLLAYIKNTLEYSIPVLILSASETTGEVQSQVAAALVKSKMSEEKILETILSLVKPMSYSGAKEKRK